MNRPAHTDDRYAAIREQFRALEGHKGYWQCLEQLCESPEFQEVARQEFPALADVWPDSLSRRKFLALMGASLGLAGISGCSVKPAPQGTIASYARAPEQVIPGRPLFYATTMVHGGDAVGLLVESHEGRPTKIEGNPNHPASLGATSVFHQASVLTLYDPARSQTVVTGDQVRTWRDAETAMQSALAEQRAKNGSGLRLLAESIVSPTLAAQIAELLRQFPEAKWHQWEPINRASADRASQLAFGEFVETQYDFSSARVVLSLDADFLTTGRGHLRHARDFIAGRLVRTATSPATAEMNRLYVVETAVTSTGAKADHRLAIRPSEVAPLAAALAAAMGVEGAPPTTAGNHQAWVEAVARDLIANAGKCIVLTGYRQPEPVHLLVHAINAKLGNVGNTIRYTQPLATPVIDPIASLRELAADLRRGAVDTLVILGSNPAYTAPVELDFAQLLAKVPHSFHLGLYENATSRLCKWHLPETHYLEAWSDARAFDGTASIAQPLIAPLYQGRSVHEVLAILTNAPVVDGRALVQSHWREQHRASNSGGRSFDEYWQSALHDGVIPSTAFPQTTPQLRESWASEFQLDAPAAPAQDDAAPFEIAFDADPSIYDGRYVNNGWLQELPKPISKLTWDNAALMSPRTAAALGLRYESYLHGGEHGGYEVPIVTLRLNDRELQTPVWLMPGHADNVVTLHVGYGQEYTARANGEWQRSLGFNANMLRTVDRPWSARGLQISTTDRTYPLACTQAHQLMGESRAIRTGTLSEFRGDPHALVEGQPEPAEAIVSRERKRLSLPESQYEPFDYDPPRRKWGMSIDTTACIGCNACVVACQAENNIPVVGKDQVSRGREMHWLRIDRYLHGPVDSPDEFHFQPVLCMHCEHAPCEYVCPVAATVHSAEGLNDMVYNRCVGTRFCSNNCPYKVRRFNFLAYADFDTVPLRLQYNPDVTVRSRGVMEKCTYCVQRIRHAEINAEAAQRPIRDGEVLTACQAVCPTQAIVFGDLNDAHSGARQLRESPLNYGLLAELNTYPRTTYLADVRNPNPELQHG
ncbi:MAG: TAT-variant-translocated molybdopterin oxidoreductase [Pirellulales bacterium]